VRSPLAHLGHRGKTAGMTPSPVHIAVTSAVYSELGTGRVHLRAGLGPGTGRPCYGPSTPYGIWTGVLLPARHPTRSLPALTPPTARPSTARRPWPVWDSVTFWLILAVSWQPGTPRNRPFLPRKRSFYLETDGIPVNKMESQTGRV